jgi:glycosyltransferase 2 family protein
VVTRAAMAERVGVPRRTTVASMVYEVPLTLCGAMVVGYWFFLRLPGLDSTLVKVALGLFPVGALAALHPAVFHRVADRALARMGRGRLERSLSFARVVSLAGLYAATFVVAGVGTYAFARALHAVDAGDTATVMGSFALAYAVSIFGFVLPAGLGAREAAFTAALAPALPAPVALAVAVGVRVLQMGVEIAYASVTPLFARRSEVHERRKASASRSESELPIS